MDGSLREFFGARENRFRLLDQGAARAGWVRGERILEIGCAAGEAARHLAECLEVEVTGVDLDAAAVEAARGLRPGRGRCVFLRADAGALPFAPASFDGAYSEAALSPLEDQERAAAEYARVLRPGALLVVNDFALRREASPRERAEVAEIPCLRGVGTVERYCALFRDQGFLPLERREVYGELLGAALQLSRGYGAPPRELGRFLARRFCGAEGDGVPAFFAGARMTYCQLLFRREATGKSVSNQAG